MLAEPGGVPDSTLGEEMLKGMLGNPYDIDELTDAIMRA